MNEDKSKLQLIGEIAEANNKNLELIEEIDEKEAMYDSLAVDYRLAQEEIERLNNIINELEKWLLEENKKKQKWYNEQLSTNDKRYYEEKYLTSLTMINVFFDKLQELKGSDKE